MTFTKRSLQILINRFLSFPHVTEEKSTFLRDKRCHFYQFLFTLSAAFLPCQKVSLGGTSFRPLLDPGYFPTFPVPLDRRRRSLERSPQKVGLALATTKLIAPLLSHQKRFSKGRLNNSKTERPPRPRHPTRLSSAFGSSFVNNAAVSKSVC